MKSGGFISIYAMLLTLAISLTGLYSLRTLGMKKEINLSLYFQKQSMLYALSTRDIALQCLENFSLTDCSEDRIDFGDGFLAQYIITKHNSIMLLDISVYANTPLITHVLQHSRRFIIKEKP